MTPSFSVKKGVRYRYYDCRLLIEGRKSDAGTIRRVSAPDVEAHVLRALAELTGTQPIEPAGCNAESRMEFLDKLVGRVFIHDGVIRIKLTPDAAASFNRPVVDIAWQRRSPRPKRDILLPHADPTKDGRPIRAEVRSSVVQAIALGRSWLQQLVSGEVKDTEVIAQREDRSKRSVHMMISLAFVAPDIVEALIAGRLPRGIGIARLTDLPLDWAKQRQVLGLSNRFLRTCEPVSG